MSDHLHVRVHLRQVIMVGNGTQARFAKVLTGIRQHNLDERLSNGEQLVAVDVYGCVTGLGPNFRITPFEPHTYLLAGANILSIEGLGVDPSVHVENCPPTEPWQCRKIETVMCECPSPHSPHRYSRGPITDCPGF